MEQFTPGMARLLSSGILSSYHLTLGDSHKFGPLIISQRGRRVFLYSMPESFRRPCPSQMVCKLLAISNGVIFSPQWYDRLPVSCPFACVYQYHCKRAQLNLFHQAKPWAELFLYFVLSGQLGTSRCLFTSTTFDS